MYCPICLRKNRRANAQCDDCGAELTPQLKLVVGKVQLKDRLIWLSVFALLCVPFFISYILLSRQRPLFMRDWSILLLLPPLCALLMIWPRRIADLLTGRKRARGENPIEYRAGTRMNLALAARYVGLYLYAVNAVSLVLRVIL